MSSSNEAKGSCLCGAVTLHAKSADPHIGACHCTMCCKWSGGPYLAVDCKDDVTFEGEDHISVYDSSEWAERGFCSKCGTHLFYRLKGNHQYFAPAGLFDSISSLDFSHQIFIDEKPEYYDFANETKNMTGAEVFAEFAGE